MRMRTVLTAALILGVLASPVAAQGSTVLYGPVDGHQALEIAASIAPVLVTIGVDAFDAGPATAPDFIGNLDASQFVLEVGPAWRVGPVHMGAGLRTWIGRVEGTQQVPVTVYIAPDGKLVDKWIAVEIDKESGNEVLRPGYQAVPRTQNQRVAVEKDGATEAALLLSGAVERGRLTASWKASYAASGLAWGIAGGYRLRDVVLTVGYRSWPMDRFYAGPMVGVELRF